MREFKEWIEERELTDNVYESIFILEDGRMISGEFINGVRELDHHCIIYLAPFELTRDEKWKYIHDRYKLVRVVPESKVALIKENQEINETQQKIVEESGYMLERY